MIIKGLNFVLTCDACPEQYNVYNNNKDIVAYVILRWGQLRCDFIAESFGENIYYKYFGENNGFMGCFENNEERMMYLDIIADKINEKLKLLDSSEEEDIWTILQRNNIMN